MTFKEYIAQCNKVLEQNPETADFIVVSSSDEEGNSYSPVYYTPTIGFYENGDWTEAESCEEEQEVNSVCIN